ncbi:radical SAM protein [Patescibacteria group bacterium]|nr:radical SAM protein [Patescibacteria group bacterium]
MLTDELLEKEIYAVDLEGQTLFYAPLTRSFAVYNGNVNIQDISKDWIKEASSQNNVPDFIRERGFKYDKDKIRLRLNITTKCNLNCQYCSVQAGFNPRNMSRDIALRSVSSFCQYAQEENANTLEIVFSGGEPTLLIPLIKECIVKAKEDLADGINLKPRILTNGLFSHDGYQEIIHEIEEIQISWDGFFGENERYGSDFAIADRVRENIRFLLENKSIVSVLTVVSEINYLRIREIVDELYGYGVKNIFLGLKETLGRAAGENVRIDYNLLGEIYFNLWKDYRKIGVDINLTGTDIHSISPFPCSVPIPNYSISPEGIISACTVSFNDSDSFADDFNIGRILKNGVKINSNALNRVRRFHVLNILDCGDCFAKWHCRGGCIYAKRGRYFTSLSPERCAMIKKIVALKLKYVSSE